MEKIILWKDPEKQTIDPKLFSKTALSLSEELAEECKKSNKRLNKRTQIRKFYDEVVRLSMLSKSRPEEEWNNILPLVHMLVAKAAYANGRKLISPNFMKFIRESIEQVQSQDDLEVFSNFFEAFMGFYRLHCPSN